MLRKSLLPLSARGEGVGGEAGRAFNPPLTPPRTRRGKKATRRNLRMTS